MTATEDPVLRLAILSMKAQLEAMTDEQRAEVFAQLFTLFCRHCGAEQPKRGSCQCWNDE